jgi:hypothetical protein
MLLPQRLYLPCPPTAQPLQTLHLRLELPHFPLQRMCLCLRHLGLLPSPIALRKGGHCSGLGSVTVGDEGRERGACVNNAMLEVEKQLSELIGIVVKLGELVCGIIDEVLPSAELRCCIADET